MMYKHKLCCELINAWKSHQLRSINQDVCRQQVIQGLSNTNIFVNLDWGMNWRIGVVTRKQNIEENKEEENELDDQSNNKSNVSHQFENTVFVHMFDHCTQDSKTVTAIIQDILKRTKSNDPQIKEAYIRLDNAGCYHCAQTLISLSQISKVTGACDRFAAVIISRIRRYLNAKHNITTAEEFVHAC
ncbi:unnamed protein product, partial [Didymodactylos carnosus]